MTRIDGESEPLPGRSVQTPEHVLGHIDDRAAMLADEMTMGMVGQVVRRRAMAEVCVHDDAELLQLVEVAINGRQMHVWRPELDRGGQFFGRGMA